MDRKGIAKETRKELWHNHLEVLRRIRLGKRPREAGDLQIGSPPTMLANLRKVSEGTLTQHEDHWIIKLIQVWSAFYNFAVNENLEEIKSFF